MRQAKVFDIQRFSVHDGPGVRTTFFLKGCPLRCRWCHNPEGQNAQSQLLVKTEKCIGCGDCVKACRRGAHSVRDGVHRMDFSVCHACGCCAESCPSHGLEIIGRWMSAEEVLKAALRDKAFYGALGGVTFSGGEALLWSEFLQDALRLCKENGLGTAIDTCGAVPWESFKRLLHDTDVFLYDIKAVNPALHLHGTGVSNTEILKNYIRLCKSGSRIKVRVPVVGGFNSNENEIRAIAEFLCANQGAEEILLMPYHKLGSNKYAELGLTYPCDASQLVSSDKMRRYWEILTGYGLPVMKEGF